MTKIIDALRELPEPYAQRAINNFLAACETSHELRKESEIKCALPGETIPHAALSEAFAWIVTPEGGKFWSDVSYYLSGDRSDLPPIPNADAQ